MSALKVGDLGFELRRSANRQTMQITVERDGSLILFAPKTCATAQLEKFVRERRFWIYTKLAEKQVLHQPVSPKQYKTGEGFAYLGRNYRLLLVPNSSARPVGEQQPEQIAPVKLTGGRFQMRREVAADGRRHMVQWYSTHAEQWLAVRVKPWARRVAVKPTGLAVMDLGFRWASCTASGKLQFHWKTILLPPHAIDYVIVHELAHLHERHHTPEFWSAVARTLPDFAARKQWLAEHGDELSGY